MKQAIFVTSVIVPLHGHELVDVRVHGPWIAMINVSRHEIMSRKYLLNTDRLAVKTD